MQKRNLRPVMLPNSGTFDPKLVSPDDSTPTPAQAASLEQIAPGIVGILAQTGVAGEDWCSNLTRTLPVITATTQQRQLLGMQVTRARAGLAPATIVPQGAPAAAKAPAWLLPVAIGVGAFLVLR